MHTSGMLAQQVEAYHAWKKELIRQISRYRNWLQDNDLSSEDVLQRLRRGLQLLLDDELTIAFVGEFSRGKTELINALFFSGFGQRMLPSQAGRTTMCPTELFYDRVERADYLLLLPIETRSEEPSLGHLRRQPDQWFRLELNPDSPEDMRETLAEVARVKSVTPEEARALGFNERTLDPDRDEPGQVLVPAWRHAMISLRHPILERGLRILDTPGLNALGSEPELTISMLPNAHAIIFLLSADAGVTASDMAIWKDFIDTPDADHRAGRFAVLNKIDVLWDDLQGEAHTQQSLDRVLRSTADHLGIQPGDVIPISAKQGLLAKIKHDDTLARRSRLPELERLIVERILQQKEELVSRNLIGDLLGMLQNSQAAMQDQLTALQQQQHLLDAKTLDREGLRRMAESTQKDYDFYYKKLITLRSSRRLMQSQGNLLQKQVDAQRFNGHVEQTRDVLNHSWTTLGMQRAMAHFFELLEADLSHLMHEGRLAEKMVNAIYQRYNEDSQGRQLTPPPLRLGRHVIALRDLKQKAERFRRHPGNLLVEQTVLTKRFFSTLASEADQLWERVRTEVGRWPDEALLPIMQYSLEQKKLLEGRIRQLKDLARSNKDQRGEREQLALQITDL
ncbi:MAG: dynamin family protein, partial [Gammaproteobacteria bacterium]|nr:dynamin family protein [Gammaproteobacteria bacterium]